MRDVSRLGLKGRVALLIGLSLGPAVFLLLYTGLEQRRLAGIEAEVATARLARLTASSQDDLLIATHQLLGVLTHVPQVRDADPATCTRFLATVHAEYPVFLNLGRIEPNGDITSSAVPAKNIVNVADRSYFRRAMETRKYAVGEYQIGRITGKPSLNFAYPMLDAQGAVRRVVFVAMDLAWIERVASKAQLPTGATVTVSDRKGTILARYPEGERWLGLPAPELLAAKQTVGQTIQGTVRATGSDGIRRLYAYTSMGNHNAGVRLSVGIPEWVAFAEVDRLLIRGLLILSVAGLLAILVALFGADLLILRSFKRLIASTEQLADGDLSVRTGLGGVRWELGDVARAFDQMAEALQLRARERQQDAQRNASLLELYEKASHLADEELHSYALDQAVALTDSAIGFFHRVSDDQRDIILSTWNSEALKTCTATSAVHYPLESAGVWAECVRLKRPVVYNDYPHAPDRKGLPEGHSPVLRFMSTPVMDEDRVKYIFGVGNKATDYDEDDLVQLQLVANELHKILRQRQAAEALRQSEHKFRFLFDTMAQGVIMQDVESHIIEVNQAACDILGRSMQQLLGNSTLAPDWRIIREDGSPLPDEQAPSRQALRTGAPVSGVTLGVWVPAAETYRWLLVSSVPRFREGEDRPYVTMTTFTDVTERKRTEEALRRVSSLLDQTQALAQVGGWEYDVEHNTLYWTSETYRIHGVSSFEYVPAVDTALDFFAPEARPTVTAAFKQAIEQGTDFSLELALLTAGGQRRWVRTTSRVIRDGGKTQRVLGALQDITDTRAAEQALRDSEEQFRTLFESAYDAILLMDGQVFVDCNPEALTMYGCDDKHDLVSHTPLDFSPLTQPDGQDSQAAALGHINAALNGAPQRFYWKHARKDGSLFDAEVSLNALRVQGRVLIQAFVRDVTQRRQAEDALRASEERFRNVVEAAPTAMHFWVLQPDGRLVLTGSNPAADRILGLDHRQLWGKTIEDAFPGLAPTQLPATYRKVAGGELGVQTFETAYKDQRFAGTYAVTVFRIAPGAIVADFADITERKRAEEALQQAHAELESRVQQRTAELSRSNAELEQFAYVASHDLQEPLRKIMAFGDRLAINAGTALDDRNRDYLSRMLNAAERMSGLINALLAYSRVTTKAQPFVPVNLTQVAGEVLTDLEIAIEEAQAEVLVGALPTIEADPQQMRQLLQNLIANALKFRRPGVPPQVRVEAEILPAGALEGAPPLSMVMSLRVRDNGIGFDEKFAHRIFEVFERLHSRDEYPGSGMGLAICRKIAQRHHGTIEASSQPGEGSVFTITLPVKQEEADLT